MSAGLDPRVAARLSMMLQQLEALEYNLGKLDAEGADRPTAEAWTVKIDELRAELAPLGF